jgi:hypothetical protein
MAGLSADVTAAPVGPVMVAVIVADAAAVDAFRTSVATDTVAEALETEGVETNTPFQGM